MCRIGIGEHLLLVCSFASPAGKRNNTIESGMDCRRSSFVLTHSSFHPALQRAPQPLHFRHP